jgi:hypothetical protein
LKEKQSKLPEETTLGLCRQRQQTALHGSKHSRMVTVIKNHESTKDLDYFIK